MGRYTNVQSYADNSDNMRTISYEQATGSSASSSRTVATGEPQRQSPSRQNEDHGKAGEDDAKASENFQRKSDDTKETQPQQEQEGQRRTAISPSSCNTTSLFVGSLHPRIGDLHLQKLFSPYGEIVRINIVTHNPNDNKQPTNIHSKSSPAPAKYASRLQQSKGYAFVEYKTIESARLAMSRLDGRQLMGKALAVRPSHRKPNTAGGGGDSSSGNKGESKVSAEDARRELGSVSSKIEAVKRAIEQKKRGL